MSYNQSKPDKSETQYRRTGRSTGNHQQQQQQQHRSSSAGYAKGVGAAGTAPAPPTYVDSSLSSNRSFQKPGNAQGGHSRVNLPPVNHSGSKDGLHPNNHNGPSAHPLKDVSARKRTLFFANLPPQSGILDIYKFFCCGKEVVGHQLIVNHEGKHVGCGFVEFASEFRTEMVLNTKNGEYLHDHEIFLDVAKIAPYPPRPKYNLAEKLWYEEYLIQRDKPSAKFCGTKTTFVDEEEAF